MERKKKQKLHEDYQLVESEIEEENVIFNTSDNNVLGSVSSSPTTTTILNPNLSGFITTKEEYGSIGADTAIGTLSPPAKKKRTHRHTARQIQELEAFCKETPLPDDKQRTELSEKIGLNPLQVKFWFQNKRTQTKAQQEKAENVMLRAENEALKTENHNLMSDLKSLCCSSCGSSGDKLRLENSRLRQKLNLLESIASFMNTPLSLSQDTVCFFPETNMNNDLSSPIAEEDKAVVMVLAVSCVQELVKMCYTNEPLWYEKRLENKESLLYLNEDEYKELFLCPPMDKCRFRREASRANGVVFMNSTTLVNAFLDADKWSEMFCSLVSKAKMIKIISFGVSGASGSLILMYAELQVLSPLVPTREGYFLRYAEHNKEQGKWMIVDFPIDRFHGLIKPASATTSTDQYRRKSSGCIIQDMPDEYSQVTWVEHVEVEEKHVHHEMVREYVQSGAAFGADRWLAVLQRQCERMVSLMATNITDLGVIPSAEARKNLMRLSQRMVRSFCLNISDSYRQSLSGSTKDTVRITSRKVGDGLVLCAVSTTFLPFSQLQVFNLLCDDHRRSQEILFNGNSVQELAHIANGSHPGNCISLLRNNVELMLQETCTDNSGCLVVYSTVDPNVVQLAMNGEDPSKIPLLPLGASIVPVNPSEGTFVNSPSCLLTVGIQVLTSNVSDARLDLSTVSAIHNRICSTVKQITSALGSSDIDN
ncbi:unnamed protein product [Arabis nemorensis]|uniref:Homeobox domain-containing protein n=1 Tax=Arabis nemorensis TaxID=586526 RepID=A0A565BKK9_9BRAS|nr:unnamed protein product [Arabis nemorensis]